MLSKLGGGVKYFLRSPLFGEDVQFHEHIFSDGFKPPTSKHLIFVGGKKSRGNLGNSKNHIVRPRQLSIDPEK